MSFDNKENKTKTIIDKKTIKYDFDKLICIICNKHLDKTESRHNCESRDTNSDLHLFVKEKISK